MNHGPETRTDRSATGLARRSVVYAAGWFLMTVGSGGAAAALPCEQPPVPAAVAAAIFAPHDATCDVNDDGAVSAADVTAAVRGPQPTPSPTVAADTPTPDGATPTPTLTPDGALPTPTPTPTSTVRRCASTGADLSIEIDNRTGINPVTVMLTGERVADGLRRQRSRCVLQHDARLCRRRLESLCAPAAARPRFVAALGPRA